MSVHRETITKLVEQTTLDEQTNSEGLVLLWFPCSRSESSSSHTINRHNNNKRYIGCAQVGQHHGWEVDARDLVVIVVGK